MKIRNFKIPKEEIFRKLLHLSSLVYPVFYLFRDKSFVLIITGIILFFVSLFDLMRLKIYSLNKIFSKYCNFLIRKEEEIKIAGSTYFMIGTFLSVFLFEKRIAIASLFVLVISDTFASIIGLLYGKNKIVGSKSLEGSVAFFLSCFLISYFFFDSKGNVLISITLTSIIVTALELFSKKIKIDDNILIPIGYGVLASFFINIL